MTKRPLVDLSSLTAAAAEPMQEASQRAARQPVQTSAPATVQMATALAAETSHTANLEGLSFKVPPAFRRRFRRSAADADLKLNELLFEALDAWEANRAKR